MLYEMAGPSCPLCKRQLPESSAGHTLHTRLCGPCQAMVQTAFRRADSGAESSIAVAPERSGVARVQAAQVLDYSLIGSHAFSEDIAGLGSGFEHQPELSPESRSSDGLRFAFFEDEDPEERRRPTEADLPVETRSPRYSEDFSNEMGLPPALDESVSAHLHAEAQSTIPVEQHLATAGSEFEAPSKAVSPVEDVNEEPPAIVEGAVTDPWEAPLPAWDYSHSEWPVLVGPSERKSRAKRKVAIPAMVVITVAAGLSFLIYRVSTPGVRTAPGVVERVSAADGDRPASKPEDPAAHSAPPSTPVESTAGSAGKPMEIAARDTAASSESRNGRGQFSLQAAAFPTQSGADEFAEKLKRAGVPSYVVPAELARRGTWFRVRVGRFNAAEEAQKFAGEAQQRGRAIGLALQLIVCQYEQP